MYFQLLLETCIVHGILLSLNMKNSLNFNDSVDQGLGANLPRDTVHPLLEVCMLIIINMIGIYYRSVYIHVRRLH